MDNNNNDNDFEKNQRSQNINANDVSGENSDETVETNENVSENGENIEEILAIKSTREMIDSQYFVPEEKKKRFAEEIFDWIEIFSSALITVILLFTFIFRLVTVEGPSMEKTLHGGDKNYSETGRDTSKDNLVISNLFYTPKQNDIVVIQLPNSSFTVPIIKRVIAVGGQTVRIDFQNWIVYVDEKPLYQLNGEPLIEPYVNYEQGQIMNPDGVSLDEMPIKVEEGKIFVMGDNRNHSTDSRNSLIGQIDVRNVVGRVLIRIFPLSKFGAVK